VSVVHASSLSQVVTSELLGAWQEEGFFKHLENVKNFYLKRRDVMVKAAEKHLTGNELFLLINNKQVDSLNINYYIILFTFYIIH